MGRYFNSANWPQGDFELTAAFQQVPDSTVSFHSSGGVHLILLKATVRNALPAAQITIVRLRLDRLSQNAVERSQTVPSGADFVCHAFGLLEIPAGPHTLDVEAVGGAGVGDVIPDSTGVLNVIELPQWEASDRIINL